MSKIGRPAGSQNKNKNAMVLLLQKKYPGYHPIMEMAAIANDLANTIEMRAGMHKEIAQYVTPKLKAVEITGSIDSRVTYKPLVKRLDGSMDVDSE